MMESLSGYHPQSNSQTERANQDLETTLRCICARNPASWSTHLTWGEYSHNSLTSAATGMTPFEASVDYLPNLFPSQEQEIAVPSVQRNLRRICRIWRETRAALLHTQHHNRRLADRWRTSAPEYKPGQKVWLSTKDIPLSITSKKLSPRFIRPFEIESIVNPSSVCLKLPPSLRIHPTLHVSQLKPVSAGNLNLALLYFAFVLCALACVANTPVFFPPCLILPCFPCSLVFCCLPACLWTCLPVACSPVFPLCVSMPERWTSLHHAAAPPSPCSGRRITTSSSLLSLVT